MRSASPVLANLFLHYSFDACMAREFPSIGFERYVDDAVVHCVSERQARHVLTAIGERMRQVGLTLHPQKARIVYCQDDSRRGSLKRISAEVRSWRLHHRTHLSEADLARRINPIVRSG